MERCFRRVGFLTHQTSRRLVCKVFQAEDAGEDGTARLLLKNRFFAGDELELMTPDGVRKITAKPFVREKTGETLDTLGVAGEIIRMKLPGSRCGDRLRGKYLFLCNTR